MNKVDLSNVPKEELERALQDKIKAEKADYQKRKENYEQNRDQLVSELIESALRIHEHLQKFKIHSVKQLEDFREKAKEYGDIRSNSKGGFSLRTSDGSLKVVFERDTRSEYDERADMAEELLKDFLADMVKLRDKQAYEVITGLLERGKKGDFNPAAISTLIKMEDKYEDDRWTKAMKLFKESFTTRLVAYNVGFYQQDNLGKDKAIVLSFSSLPAEPENENETTN